MNLIPGKLVFGVAPALLIDCARQIHDVFFDEDRESITVEKFSRWLGAPVRESRPVFEAMQQDGYFETKEDGRIVRTTKVSQLALAKLSPGIPRAEAEKLLAEIVSKAKWINERPNEFDNRILRLVVFGSFLSEKPLLGDLDIGLEMQSLKMPRGHLNIRKPMYPTHQEAIDSRRTITALKLRQPNKISIHSVEEVESLNTPSVVIFTAAPVSKPGMSRR